MVQAPFSIKLHQYAYEVMEINSKIHYNRGIPRQIQPFPHTFFSWDEQGYVHTELVNYSGATGYSMDKFG